MKRYAYMRDDGGLSIVCPAPKADIERNLGRALSDEEYDKIVYEHSITRPLQEGLINIQGDVQEIETDELPPRDNNGGFRDAWKLENGKVVEDLDKAKAIVADRIRAEREPLLKALDVEFSRALETDNAEERNRIVAEKQKLRDVTEVLKGDSIKSPLELRGKTLEDFLNAT